MTNYSVRLEITTGNTEQRLQTLRRELAKVEQSGLKMTNSLNGAVISQSVKMLTDTITKMGRGSSSASSDVEKLQKQLLQAQTKSENLAKSLDRANIRLARLGQAFEKSKAMGTKFANEIKQANAKIDEMSKKMQKTEQEVQKAKRAFGGLGDLKGKLQSLAGFTIFGMGVADVLKTADTMKTLDTQIKLVTKSEQEHAAVKANLYNISNKTRQDITSTIEAYTNNARSLGQLGKNQAEVLKFTENISLAMAVGGKSAQEQSAALLQLGQAMQSGVLQGDEFRSIAENSPILLDLIAEKLGKTRGEVKKLASDGKITSEVIYQSVIGAGDELNKKFATMPATMSQALTVVQNRYTQAVDDFFNKSGGLGEQIAKSLLWVSDNFGTLTNTVMGLGVVYGGYMALNSKFVSTTIPTKIAALAASTRAFHAESVAINANTAAKIRNDGVIKTLTASLKATRIGRFTSSLAGATAELGKGTARMVGYANEARKTHGTLGALRLGVVNTTTAIFNKNRAIGVLHATKGKLIGTAGRLGGVMTTLGRAILGVGAIIKAHPIMFIAGIITTVITATMGLENAMKSFGDAVGIVGLMVKDFVKWAVDGIGNQMTKAIDFMAGFFGSKSKDGTNQASNAFKDFFKTSQGGFVGLLEITAKIFDQIVTMAKASMLYASSYVGDMVISVKNAYNAMMPSWMGGGGEQQATRNMSFSDAIFQSQSFTARNWVGNAQTILRADEYNRNQALQHDLGQVGTGGLNKLGEETKKAKLKGEDEKYTYTKEELKALQKVHGLIYGSELKKYAEQQGVPVHMLAGLMMQESKGEQYAKSHTGALGYFQTTSGYRKDMGLSEKDSYDLIKSGRAAIDFLSKSYQEFGNWNDAIRSYNAGRGGARTFNKTGKVSGSAARNKEVAEYVPKIARYAAYFNNGKSELGKNSNAAQQSYEFTEKQLKTQEELLKAQQELILKYSDHNARQLATLEADKKAVYDAFGQDGEETRKLIEIIEGRYKLSAELRQQEQLLEMQGYQMSTEERMALEHTIHDLKIKLSDEYGIQEKEIYLRASEQKYQQDLAMFKRLQQQKIQELEKPIKAALDEQERIAIARMNQKTMRPDDYRRWELSQEMAGVRRTADDAYVSQFRDIFRQNDNGQYEIESLDERLRLWEEAYRLHKETIANIDAEYGEKSKVLEDELLSAKLSAYGSAAGALAGLFKDMSGEQSRAYRAMFAVSKAFAIAEAGKNVWLAASDAFAKEPGTVWQKLAAAATATAKSSSFIPLINAINPKGFKSGGYTGNIGVNSIAGVVHGQEYVMNAKATKRIGVNNLERLSNGEGIGGVKVIINNYSNETATAEQMPNGDIMVTIGKAARYIARDEIQKYHQSQLRQGGIYYGR
ncbi:tape measure protein [Moraxella bovoculi]|uniref:tape measure protein n=1 Tax=Moraxella bovoculi TaxID=386891 RepID=UPI0006247C78|nr:tape measure protein [Moraxella bovoculi]AKG14155.1 hypothetical protein AAX11_09155 [Moraxella bovoculi]